MILVLTRAEVKFVEKIMLQVSHFTTYGQVINQWINVYDFLISKSNYKFSKDTIK